MALVFSQAGTGHPEGWRFGLEVLGRGLGGAPSSTNRNQGTNLTQVTSSEARIAAAHGVEVQFRDVSLLAASVVADLVAVTAWAVMLLWGS